jgi:predicted AAA+ superfamily ATPase
MALRPIAQTLAVDEKTVRAYVRLLELLYLVVRVPAWTPGARGRAVRAPRIAIEDSGLLAHLLDADSERIAADETITGCAYESWVMMELGRLLPHTETAPRMWHWRSHHGEEVDIVLEDRRAGSSRSRSRRGGRRATAICADSGACASSRASAS